MSLEFKDTISSKIEFLELRALALQKARSFFIDKNYIEVDVPAVVKFPSVDAHIDSFQVSNDTSTIGYLHTSPEYLMKRLLANGMKKIFYLGHVFRIDEIGKLHNPEFTMIEWYQVGITLDKLIEEVLNLCKLFLNTQKVIKLTYQDAFYEFIRIDPFTSDRVTLEKYAKENGIDADLKLDKDGWLQLLFSYLIEPKFDTDTFYIISHYPKTQAALSKTTFQKGFEVAQRFEIYYNQVELANGYFELTDPNEQTKRFINENKKRTHLNKNPYPLDNKFINSLKNIPDCCGVSIGFDRLLMLANKLANIKDVLPFNFESL